ncbi:hypothetical protein NX059_009923 [Plenodomus lindquistii]|nr:hypothetical protein NX059_009923 [Plenodomus lindquistii]
MSKTPRHDSFSLSLSATSPQGPFQTLTTKPEHAHHIRAVLRARLEQDQYELLVKTWLDNGGKRDPFGVAVWLGVLGEEEKEGLRKEVDRRVDLDVTGPCSGIGGRLSLGYGASSPGSAGGGHSSGSASTPAFASPPSSSYLAALYPSAHEFLPPIGMYSTAAPPHTHKDKGKGKQKIGDADSASSAYDFQAEGEAFVHQGYAFEGDEGWQALEEMEEDSGGNRGEGGGEERAEEEEGGVPWEEWTSYEEWAS